MQPKLIIFDWDGTLADTTQPIIHTMQAAFQTCGFNAPADDAIRLHIGNSLHGIIAQLAPQLNAAQQQQIAQAYTVSYLNPNNHNMTLFDDARACLDTLQQQGYGLAVATGKGRIGLNQAIAQTDTAHYWLTTRCASECPAKPAPDMVLETELNPTNNAISLERLPDLDAGYLIVSAGYGASSANNQGVADQRLANLKKDELWKNLPAVKADHVLQVDSTLWMAHGIIAKERAMKELYDTWGE